MQWRKLEEELGKMDKFPTTSYKQDLKYVKDSRVYKNLIPFLLDSNKSNSFQDFLLPKLVPLIERAKKIERAKN